MSLYEKTQKTFRGDDFSVYGSNDSSSGSGTGGSSAATGPLN